MLTRENYFSHNVKKRNKWSREWLVERQLTSDGKRVAAVFSDGRLPRFAIALDILELTDWPLHVGCSLHDVHNSGEKGMVIIIARGKDFVDHLRSITVALRGGYGFLFGGFAGWVLARLQFEEPSGRADDAAATRAFFMLCGVDTDTIEVLCRLGFHAGGGEYFVSSEYDDDSEAIEVLLEVLLRAFDFITFTLSRWLSVKRAAGRVLFALCLGLDDYVPHVVRTVHGAAWHLAGYKKYISVGVRYMAASSCIVMTPCEVLESLLLHDDRMFVQYESYLRAFRESRRQMLSLPVEVYEIILSLLREPDGTMGNHLRSDAVGGLVMENAYAHRVLFSPYEEYPHRLAINWGVGHSVRMAIRENLEALRGLEQEVVEELDYTTRKIYFSMKLGVKTVEECAAAIELWRHWSCSAAMVEQGHGAFASAKKNNGEYSAERIQEKGFARSFRTTTTAKDPRKASMKKLEQLIADTESHHPEKMRSCHLLSDEKVKEFAATHRRHPNAAEKNGITAEAIADIKTMDEKQRSALRDKLPDFIQARREYNAEVVTQATGMKVALQSEMDAEARR
eukprot:g19252.t1